MVVQRFYHKKKIEIKKIQKYKEDTRKRGRTRKKNKQTYIKKKKDSEIGSYNNS